MPSGTWTIPPAPLPPTHDADILAAQVADALVAGNGALKNRAKMGVTEDDRKRLQRIAGVSIEDFNAKITAKLGDIGDRVLDQIKDRLEKGHFKTSELAFLYSVMHDKRAAMDGKSQVSNAAINIQINNNGTSLSKEDLISMLEGRKAPMPAQSQEPVEIEAERKAG